VIDLHGEAAALMKDWRVDFHAETTEHVVPPEMDQQCKPNWAVLDQAAEPDYVNKADRKDFAGCKQMKAKERLTIMVANAADGSKLPLVVIGKPFNPVCFKYEPDKDRKLPGLHARLPYGGSILAFFTSSSTGNK
jgi:hypothetical protein